MAEKESILSEGQPRKEGPNRRVYLAIILPLPSENSFILVLEKSPLGLWTLPGGGMKEGEEIEETAARELYEELNLHVPPQCIDHVYTVENLEDPVHGIIDAILVATDIKNLAGHLYPQEGEVDGFGYFRKEHARESVRENKMNRNALLAFDLVEEYLIVQGKLRRTA